MAVNGEKRAGTDAEALDRTGMSGGIRIKDRGSAFVLGLINCIDDGVF